MKVWDQTDRLDTETLLKSISHENYNFLSSKFKNAAVDPESSNVSFFDEDKRKKVIKKVKIVS